MLWPRACLGFVSVFPSFSLISSLEFVEALSESLGRMLSWQRTLVKNWGVSGKLSSCAQRPCDDGFSLGPSAATENQPSLAACVATSGSELSQCPFLLPVLLRHWLWVGGTRRHILNGVGLGRKFCLKTQAIFFPGIFLKTFLILLPSIKMCLGLVPGPG